MKAAGVDLAPFAEGHDGRRKATESKQAGAEYSPLSASFRQGEMLKLMVVLGCSVGIIAFLYDGAMDLSLRYVWKVIPGYLERAAAESEDGLDTLNKWGFLYTIVASTTLAIAAGASVKFLGFPGDLPDVIRCIHEMGYVPMCRALPMICCSLFSIAAGGSVGPEAPLAAVSASLSGYISMRFFNHDMVMVRKCTIIGIAAALSALFGVQLGGALFALEVLHTMGMQYFDVTVYAVGAGGICLAVFRGLQGEKFGAIWSFPDASESSASEVVLGAVVGAIAGGVGIGFRSLFHMVEKGLSILGLGHFDNTQSPILLCALGGFLISVLGVLVPPTMFWSEFEIGSIAEPGKNLPHIWPQGGIFYGLERYPWESAPMNAFVGLVKLLAIALTVQSGLRGGFIFPLFFAGAALGHALLPITDMILPPGLVAASPALLCVCFATGLNVAVMRTPFASALILSCLSGQPSIMTPAMCAALASLFVTRSSKFIVAQSDRADIRFLDDLLPLEKPLRSSSSVATDSEAGSSSGDDNCDNGGSSAAGPDAEMGSLLIGKGRTGHYRAMEEGLTER